MKTYSLTHKQLVLERLPVAWGFFGLGSFFGLLVSTWLPPGFLADRSYLMLLLFLVTFALMYPVMLLLKKAMGQTTYPESVSPDDQSPD